VRWAEVNALFFDTGLEEDSRWHEGGEGEGGEEVVEECRWRGRLVGRRGVMPRIVQLTSMSSWALDHAPEPWFGVWLGVRIEEDIGCDFSVVEGFDDVLGLGKEVRGDVLNIRAVLFQQKGHHAFTWSQLEMGGRHRFPS
jgi:hypothetical protein